METAIKLRLSGRTPAGELVHLRANAVAQSNEGTCQGVELILQPRAGSCVSSYGTMEAVQKRTDLAIPRIQPLVPTRCQGARGNLIELPLHWSCDGVSYVLHKAALEEQGQGLGGRGPPKFEGVLLAMIEDEESIIGDQVPPLSRRIQ